MSNQQASTDSIELQKRLKMLELYNDNMRHLTTLVAGFLVLFSTFLEKLFLQPINRWMVGATIASLAGSLVIFGFGMISAPDSCLNKSEAYFGFFALGLVFFIIGIVLLALFAISNYYGFQINV